MSSDEKFGDRVTVSDLPDFPIQGGLPHPQDPWRTASGLDTPFQGATPSAGSRQLGAPTSYDPHGGTIRDPLAEAAARAATPAAPPPVTPAPPLRKEPAGPRPVPPSSTASRKETATLRRFREVFGLQRVKVVDAPILRRDPQNQDQNVEIVFGLRGVNYEDYQWILEKTQTLMQTPALATFAWKIAFASMGVASIDGVPLWEVLGFEPADPEHIRDPMYPHMGLRFQAAEAFCDELRATLFDTVENLYAAYEEKIDSHYLPKKNVVTDTDKEEGPQSPLTQTGSGS